MSGKWHIGQAALQRAGFSYWNVHAAGGGHYYEAPMILNGDRYQPDEYVTDVITDNALEFLNAQTYLRHAVLAQCALHRPARPLGSRGAS